MEGLSHIMKANNGQQKKEEVQYEPSQQQVDAFLSQNDGVLDMVEKIASGKIAQGKKNGEIYKPDSFDKMIKGIAKQVMIENRQQKLSTAAAIQQLREEAARNVPTQNQSPKAQTKSEVKTPDTTTQTEKSIPFNTNNKNKEMHYDLSNQNCDLNEKKRETTQQMPTNQDQIPIVNNMDTKATQQKATSNEQVTSGTDQNVDTTLQNREQQNIAQLNIDSQNISEVETPSKKQKVEASQEQDLLGGFEGDFFGSDEPMSVQKEPSTGLNMYNQGSAPNDDLFDSIMNDYTVPATQSTVQNSNIQEGSKNLDDTFTQGEIAKQNDTTKENDTSFQGNTIEQVDTTKQGDTVQQGDSTDQGDLLSIGDNNQISTSTNGQGTSSIQAKSSDQEFFDTSSQKLADSPSEQIQKPNRDVQSYQVQVSGDSNMSFKSTTEQSFYNNDSTIDGSYKDAISNQASMDSTLNSQSKTGDEVNLQIKQNDEKKVNNSKDNLMDTDIKQEQQPQQQQQQQEQQNKQEQLAKEADKQLQQGDNVQIQRDAQQGIDLGFGQDESMAWGFGSQDKPHDQNGVDSNTSKDDIHLRGNSSISKKQALNVGDVCNKENENGILNGQGDNFIQQKDGKQQIQEQDSVDLKRVLQNEPKVSNKEQVTGSQDTLSGLQHNNVKDTVEDVFQAESSDQQASLNDSVKTLNKDQLQCDSIDDSARSKDFASNIDKGVIDQNISEGKSLQTQKQIMDGNQDSITKNGSSTKYEVSSTSLGENSAQLKENPSINSSTYLSQQKEIIKAQSNLSEAIVTVDNSNASDYPKVSLGSDQFYLSRSQKLGQDQVQTGTNDLGQKFDGIQSAMEQDQKFRDWQPNFETAIDTQKNKKTVHDQNKELNEMKDMAKFFNDKISKLEKNKSVDSIKKQNKDSGIKAFNQTSKANFQASNEYLMQQERLMKQQIEQEERDQQEQQKRERQRKKAERRKRNKSKKQEQNRLDGDISSRGNFGMHDNEGLDSNTSDDSSSDSKGSSQSTLTAHSLSQKQSENINQTQQPLGFINQKSQPDESPNPSHPLFQNFEKNKVKNTTQQSYNDPIFGDYPVNNTYSNGNNENGRDKVYANITKNQTLPEQKYPKSNQILQNLSLSSATTTNSEIQKQQSAEDQLKVYSNISYQSRANSGHYPDINQQQMSTTAFKKISHPHAHPKDMPVSDRSQGSKITQDPQLSGIMSFQKDIRESFEKQLNQMKKLKQEQEQAFLQQQTQMQEQIMQMESKFSSWSRQVYEWQQKNGVSNASYLNNSYESQLENKLNSVQMQNQGSNNYPLFDMFLNEDGKQRSKVQNYDLSDKIAPIQQSQILQQQSESIDNENNLQRSYAKVQLTAPERQDSSAQENSFRNYLNQFGTQQNSNQAGGVQPQVTPSRNQQYPIISQALSQKLHTPASSSTQSAKQSRSMQLLEKQRLNSVVTLKSPPLQGIKIPFSAPPIQGEGSSNQQGVFNTGNQNLNSTLKNLMDILPYTYDTSKTNSGQPHTQVFQQTTDLGQQAVRTCVVTVQYPVQKEEKHVNRKAQKKPDVVQALDFSKVDGFKTNDKNQSIQPNSLLNYQAQQLGNKIATEGVQNGNIQQIENGVLKLIHDDVYSTKQYLQSLSPQIMTVNQKLDLLLGQRSTDSEQSQQQLTNL